MKVAPEATLPRRAANIATLTSVHRARVLTMGQLLATRVMRRVALAQGTSIPSALQTTGGNCYNKDLSQVDFCWPCDRGQHSNRLAIDLQHNLFFH